MRQSINHGAEAVPRARPMAFEPSGDLLRLVRSDSIRWALVRKTRRVRGGPSRETSRDERHLPGLLRRTESGGQRTYARRLETNSLVRPLDLQWLSCKQ